MRHVTVSERAVRDLVREALGGEVDDDESVKVNDVVDPSAALTDPGNEDYKPNNRVELQVAVKALSDDLPPEQVPGVYDKLVGALKVSQDKDEDGEDMKKKDTKVESLVRAEIRRQLEDKDLHEAFGKKPPKVFGPVVGPLPPVTKIPAGVHGGEYMRGFNKGKKDLKAIMKSDAIDDFGGAVEDPQAETPEKRKFSTMTDVEGASFQEIAKSLGFSVAGAKQAVDKALQKAQWVGAMQEDQPDDLEIIVLARMNDYIKMLTKTGQLSSADVQLMRDHPDIVRELDGFREFLDKAIRKARKPGKLENPLGETKTFKRGNLKIVLEKTGSNSRPKVVEGSKYTFDPAEFPPRRGPAMLQFQYGILSDQVLTGDGLSVQWLETKASQMWKDAVAALVDKGYLKERKGKLYPTPAGKNALKRPNDEDPEDQYYITKAFQKG